MPFGLVYIITSVKRNQPTRRNTSNATPQNDTLAAQVSGHISQTFLIASVRIQLVGMHVNDVTAD